MINVNSQKILNHFTLSDFVILSVTSAAADFRTHMEGTIHFREFSTGSLETMLIFMSVEQSLLSRRYLSLISSEFSAFAVYEKFGANAVCFVKGFFGKGAMGMSGDGAMNPDGKPKTDIKDDSGTTNEHVKPKVFA